MIVGSTSDANKTYSVGHTYHYGRSYSFIFHTLTKKTLDLFPITSSSHVIDFKSRKPSTPKQKTARIGFILIPKAILYRFTNTMRPFKYTIVTRWLIDSYSDQVIRLTVRFRSSRRRASSTQVCIAVDSRDHWCKYMECNRERRRPHIAIYTVSDEYVLFILLVLRQCVE